jgi:hypothetical protein
MQILEDRIPLGAGQFVDAGDGLLGIARAIGCPAGQQRRHEVGDRPTHGLIDVLLGGGVFLLLQIMHANDQPRDAVGFVDGQDTVGEFHRGFDVAFRERRDEGPIQQFAVLRIGAQRRTIEGGRGLGIALDAGMTRSEIAARLGHGAQIVSAREWRSVGRMLGRLCRQRSGQDERGRSSNGNRQAIETNGQHRNSPSSRVSRHELYDSLGCATRPAASS